MNYFTRRVASAKAKAAIRESNALVRQREAEHYTGLARQRVQTAKHDTTTARLVEQATRTRVRTESLRRAEIRQRRVACGGSQRGYAYLVLRRDMTLPPAGAYSNLEAALAHVDSLPATPTWYVQPYALQRGYNGQS